MKPKYLLFLVVILLVFCVTYFNVGGNWSRAKVTNNQNSLNSQSAKSESSFSSAEPVSMATSSSLHSEKKVAIKYISFSKYTAMLPDLKRFENSSRNAIYSVGIDVTADQLNELKGLAEAGDATAKSIYANRLAAKLYARLQEDISLNSDAINKQKWQRDFAEVQRLLIEAATAGEYLAALQLTMFPPVVVTGDREEVLAWALIADKLSGPSGGSVQRTCAHFESSCTPQLMESSVKRALMYIDLYKIKSL